jgi:hypothetical protein
MWLRTLATTKSISQTTMAAPKPTCEPFEINLRFHSALWAKVCHLEANVQKDELVAGRFRDFLAGARVRVR